MDDITNKIQSILLADNPEKELVNFVYELSSQGLTRQDIYNLLLQYHKDNKNSDNWNEIENKNGGDHPIDITLDRLCGWCSKDSILLANEPFQNE